MVASRRPLQAQLPISRRDRPGPIRSRAVFPRNSTDGSSFGVTGSPANGSQYAFLQVGAIGGSVNQTITARDDFTDVYTVGRITSLAFVLSCWTEPCHASILQRSYQLQCNPSMVLFSIASRPRRLRPSLTSQILSTISAQARTR